MREIPVFVRLRAAALPLGLLCVSLACLCAGGLLAAAEHGLLRAVYGGSGFAAYVYFFARALGEIGFPRSGVP